MTIKIFLLEGRLEMMEPVLFRKWLVSKKDKVIYQLTWGIPEKGGG